MLRLLAFTLPLCLDNFAIAFAVLGEIRLTRAQLVRVTVVFIAFEAIMPLIGLAVGTPLIHLLPRSWQLRIVPRFSVWAAVTRATPDRRRFYLEHYLRDIRLLGPAEFHALFPGATVLRERLLGLTKSMVAIKHAHGRPDSRLNPGRSEVR